jgi:shikimate kinase/3-dehydroquinate synthase
MASALTLAGARTVACIGFMGAGKSTAANAIARLTGKHRIDVDHVIEQRAGKTIERIFTEDGEAGFRAAEERITLELLGDPSAPVLALGGGAIESPAVRAALAEHLVLWIDVDLDTAWRRVQNSGRPLAKDRREFELLYARRDPLYAELADVVVPSQSTTSMDAVLASVDEVPRDTLVVWAASGSGGYPVYIGEDLLEGHHFWPSVVGGRRFLVTDGNAGRLYGRAFDPLDGRVAIMPGEQSKTIAHAEIVWTELVRAGMTRDDVVVALGGGVVGDLAGFCAATFQRGVRYVQVPTTLVAQVDSAYGGKTGVDLPEAKNYVGAYHQPSAVLTDTRTLASLPAAELAAGYAEVVKTALIAGGDLWERVRAGADSVSPQVISACVLTKLRIVAQDERDQGVRQVLNLGHTVGHAIETSTGYARYRHGEAVALGLLAALRLSGQPALREEVLGLFRTHGLPTRMEDADPDAVVMATARDKKRLGDGPVPFVLLNAAGQPRPGCTVAPRDLIAAVRELA